MPYPWLNSFSFRNGSSVKAREIRTHGTSSWAHRTASLSHCILTGRITGVSAPNRRPSIRVFSILPAKTQPEAAAEITYTNLSGEDKTLSFTFNGVLTDENGKTGWKPLDLASETDGSGRFTLTLTRGEQVQQYNVELLLHRTLKSLTVSANGDGIARRVLAGHHRLPRRGSRRGKGALHHGNAVLL